MSKINIKCQFKNNLLSAVKKIKLIIITKIKNLLKHQLGCLYMYIVQYMQYIQNFEIKYQALWF